MKYEHTHLSVKVTATGNTAREMSRWSDAARTEYLCDQAVLFLNGKRPDLFVEVVDLKAAELERAMPRSDKVGLAGRGEMAPVPEAAGATANTAEEQRATKPTPQPVDAGGEWLMLYNTLIQYSNRSPVRWYNSEPNSGIDCWSWDFNIDQGAKPIAHAAALAWLRANGHAKVADELEGERRPA